MAFTPEGRNSEESRHGLSASWVFGNADKGAKRGGGFFQVKDVLE